MNRNETATQTPNIQFIPEPTIEPVEQFVSREEREYRAWKQFGGDIAFLLVELLSHGRRAEISMSEIATTQLFKRSNAEERLALQFVCSESAEIPIISGSDGEKLKLNDQLLMDFCDGKLLGHRDFRTRVLSIPAKLDEKRHFDQRMLPFAIKYENPTIFAWIISERPRVTQVVSS